MFFFGTVHRIIEKNSNNLRFGDGEGWRNELDRKVWSLEMPLHHIIYKSRITLGCTVQISIKRLKSTVGQFVCFLDAV